MTRLPGLDAWLTREPTFTPDLHAPFTALGQGGDGRTWWVVDDREGEDAGPIIVFRGDDAIHHALRYEWARNAQHGREYPPDEDGPHGSCTVCGDFHGEPW